MIIIVLTKAAVIVTVLSCVKGIGREVTMPNIFDGIRKMNDDELRLQIAMLEQINLVNAAKETGNRVLAGLADVANSFVKSFSQGMSLEYEVTKVADRVSRSYRSLNDKSREELLEYLKLKIFEKCGVEETQRENISEEKLTFIMANEAGAMYFLEKYETCANKIEEISIQYNKAFLETLHNMLVRQTPRQVEEADRKLQKRLDDVSIEIKREIQRNIYPKDFSGAGIGRVLRLERGTKNLQYVVTFLGIESFDYIQVYVATALMAVKSLKKVSRALLAELICKAMTSYGEKFTVNEDILPSYMPYEMQAEFAENEKKFRSLITARNEFDRQLKKAEEALHKNEEQTVNAREKLDKLTAEFDEAGQKFVDLESKKDRYVNNMMPENDTKRYYNDVNDTKRRLDRAEEQVEKQKQQLAELEKLGVKLQTDYDNMVNSGEEQRQQLEKEIQQRGLTLRNKWQAFYYKLTFEDNLFDEIVKEFVSDEWLNIERMLKEMHDNRDLTAYETKPGEIYCSLTKSKTAIIKINEAHISEIVRA